MQKVKNFAVAASAAVNELLAAASPADRQRIAEAFSGGVPLSLTFTLRVGSKGTVSLDIGEPLGARQMIVSVDATQPQIH